MQERIIFQGDDPKEQEFVRELRRRVRTYFMSNNISTGGGFEMYFKTVFMLGLYALPFVAILAFEPDPWIAISLVILMGIGEAGIGMSVMHDAVHDAYSNNRWINRIMGFSMFLLGSNIFNWKVQHNINHHTYTNIYGRDPDISTKAVIRLCEHAPIKKYNKYQHLYAFPLYGLMTFMRLFGDIPTLIRLNKEGITEQQKVNPTMEMIRLITTKVVYFSVFIGLPLIFTSYNIWQILLGFTVLHITAGMIMTTVFQMAHVVEGAEQLLPDEDNIIHNEWMVHQLRSASDFGRANGLLSWYIGGLDYQVEHHLFPNICHVHYPEIAAIVEETSHEYGIPYNLKPSFAYAIRSHYRRLKELGHVRSDQIGTGDFIPA